MLRLLVCRQTCRVFLCECKKLTAVWLRTDNKSRPSQKRNVAPLPKRGSSFSLSASLSLFLIPAATSGDLRFCPSKILQNNSVFFTVTQQKHGTEVFFFFPPSASLGSRWLAACCSLSLNPSTLLSSPLAPPSSSFGLFSYVLHGRSPSSFSTIHEIFNQRAALQEDR